MNKTQEIKDHLSKTKQEFDDHLSGKEKRFLFELALQTPERQEKIQKILTWISEELNSGAGKVEDLYSNWNENQKDYDGSLDFGGRLLTLKSLLEKTNEPQGGLTESEKNIIKQLPGIIFSINSFFNSLNSLYLTRAEELFAEFNKNDLSIKANPNLNEGITQERRSNTQRISNGFKQSIEVCKKMEADKNS